MGSSGALADIRVVEFSQNLAVPQCGRLLSGMGAQVIKVEPIAGDAMRHLAKLTSTESRIFASTNAGKRAMCIDLASPRARPVVRALVKSADVVLVGVKPTDQARYGLDWETISQLNPGVVGLLFTANGPEGPDADRPGYDPLTQAASGLGYSMNRTIDGYPMPSRPAYVDMAAGSIACLGVVAALRHRDRTGQGQRVDGSLLGGATAIGHTMMSTFEVDAADQAELAGQVELMQAQGADFETVRDHYESRYMALGTLFRIYTRTYATADGLISIAGYSPALRTRFDELVGLAERDLGAGADSVPVVEAAQAVEALFATKTTDEWISILTEVGYPCAKYNLPHQAYSEPQALANDYSVDLDHPEFGTYRTAGMPFQMSTTPTSVCGPSPTLGADTRAVLVELGWAAPDIETLVADGVIR